MNQPDPYPSPRGRRLKLQACQAELLCAQTPLRAAGSALLAVLGIVLIHSVYGSPARELWLVVITLFLIGSIVLGKRAHNANVHRLSACTIGIAVAWCLVTCLVVPQATPTVQMGWLVLSTILGLLNAATGAGLTQYHSLSTVLLIGPGVVLMFGEAHAGIPLAVAFALLTMAVLFIGLKHDEHLRAKLTAKLESEELSRVLLSMQARLQQNQDGRLLPSDELLIDFESRDARRPKETPKREI
jgi:hypothetical protein